MKKLTENDYFKVENLFKNLNYNLAIKSILKNNTRGQIYVDNLDKPQTVCLWNEMTELFIAGKISDVIISKMKSLIYNKLIPDAKRRYIPGFNIYYSNNEWKNKLKEIFNSYELKEEKRYFFEFKGKIYNWIARISEQVKVIPIDYSLLKSNYKNIEEMRGWIDSFWRNYDDFQEKGIGYCLLKSNTLCSWSFSVYVSGSYCELAVATIEEKRRQGYAKLVSAAATSDSIVNGFNPQWHCNKLNQASIAIAEKIGFKKDREYTIIEINF